MSGYVVGDLRWFVGKLETDPKNHWSEWKLKTVLEDKGYNVVDLYIRDATKEFPKLDIKVLTLVTEVWIKLTDEQKKQHNVQKNLVVCVVPARYKGTEEDWNTMLFTNPDDISIRYIENIHNEAKILTFTGAFYGKEHPRLRGERIEWDDYFIKERYREEFIPNEGFYEEPCEPNYDFIEETSENEELLLDAYGGDLDNWRCR